jgi:beta-glucosidase-like glycosyl hydrolase
MAIRWPNFDVDVWQTPGEDPRLTSEYVFNFVTGMQYGEVIHCTLHIATCNPTSPTSMPIGS